MMKLGSVMRSKLPLCLFFALVAGNSYSQSMPTLSKDAIMKCADAGVAECQYKLAAMVEDGKLFQRDLSTAKALYEMAYKNGHEQAGADILRLAKDSGKQEGAVLAIQSEKPDSSPIAAVGSVVGAKGTAYQVPQNEPVKVGPGNSELRFGGAYIGQAEAGFSEAVRKASCEDDDFEGFSVRTCGGVIRRGGGEAHSVEAMFYDDRMFSLGVTLDTPEQCNALIEDFSHGYGKPIARWRSGFVSSITGTLLKSWGKKDEWAVMVMCDPPKAGGMAMLFGGGFAQLSEQMKRKR